MSDVDTLWPVVSLFDVCNPKQWPTIPQTAFVEEGYPVYGANGRIGFYTEFNHEKPTVLITCRGATCGTINVCQPKSYVTGNAMALDDLDESRCCAEYLVYALRTGSLSQAISGTAQPQITRQGLTAISIPLPPLAEQRRIAEVLDRAEALRAKRRAALAQLDSLTQSLFLDLFGDPISNPKEWPTARFEDLCHRVTVGIVVRPSSYYVANGVPALRSLNVKPGKIVLDDVVYFSESDNENQLKKTRLLAGDLVLVRTGQPGTAAVVPPELDGVNAIDLLITTPRITVVSAKFLCEFFNSSGGRDLVLSAQRGQIQKHLNVGSLAEAVIPLPPLKLQHEFARRVTAVETLKTAHRTSLAELDSLFATLQHRAFRGEL